MCGLSGPAIFAATPAIQPLHRLLTKAPSLLLHSSHTPHLLLPCPLDDPLKRPLPLNTLWRLTSPTIPADCVLTFQGRFFSRTGPVGTCEGIISGTASMASIDLGISKHHIYYNKLLRMAKKVQQSNINSQIQHHSYIVLFYFLRQHLFHLHILYDNFHNDSDYLH